MRVDPEKVGVWVPLYVIQVAPSGSSALMLAQLTWLLQEDRTKTRRVPVVVEQGVEWLARADTDWGDVGLDRGGAYRARVALVKAGLIEVQTRRRPCWLKPDYDTLRAARSRAIADDPRQHASVLPTTRKRAEDNTEARDPSLLSKTTPQTTPNTTATPGVLLPDLRAPEPGSDEDPLFTEFWTLYPRGDDKGGARKAWRAAIKKVSPDVIVEGVRRYSSDPNLPDRQYVPHARTWLNGERWGDPRLPSRPHPNGSTPSGVSAAVNRLKGGGQ